MLQFTEMAFVVLETARALVWELKHANGNRKHVTVDSAKQIWVMLQSVESLHGRRLNDLVVRLS